ncbi:MAG TPA: hypothetical protein PLG17_09485, partial [Thermodesulfobacteriota bacterium]|nr:hypothetical protein [Thermodesulfobacteriota bacterium]
MGGSFPPEQLAGLLRNHWQVTAGIRNNAEQRFAAILEGKIDPGYTVDGLSDTEEEIVSVTD